MHESDSLVIIPTYNEKENIEKIIRAVFGLNKCFHILVIDDGSIVQRGTHSELMAQEGVYRRFVNIREEAIGWKIGENAAKL